MSRSIAESVGQKNTFHMDHYFAETKFTMKCGITNPKLIRRNRTMKRHNLLTVVKMMVGAFVTFAALGGSASANHLNSWAIAGAGCVPVGQTSSAHLVFNSAGDAGFAAGTVGEIILTCPVVPTIDSAYTLTITYRDTDGVGTGASITAALRRKSVTTGSVVTLSSVDTNSGPVVTNYGTMGTFLNSCNPLTFDFNNYVYYVQINIRRTSTGQQPLFGAASLNFGGIC
jgi:hypothetical protein